MVKAVDAFNRCQTKNDMTTFKVVSLFAGAGLLDLGFMNSGFQIVEAIEVEPIFCKTYNYALEQYCKNSNNFYIRNKLVVHNHIKSPQSASDKQLHRRLKKQYRGIDGIIGGPPCQDFSVAGKNAGILGERGKLLQSYCEIVKSVLPKFIFFENVEGLYNKHKAGFDDFVLELEKHGYEVWHTVLNSLEYGFAQDRPRIALVGFRKEIINKLTKQNFVLEKNNTILKTSDNKNFVFRWPKVKYENPKGLPWPKATSFQNSQQPQIPYCLPKELMIVNTFAGITKNTPNQNECFKSYSKKFWERDEGDTTKKSFKRLHRFRYSPTAAYGNNEVHLHPTEPRRLTVREALRIQTVPDEYIMPSDVPMTHKFKMIGNGVPVKKAELIAKEIRNTLFKAYSGTNTKLEIVS